MSVASDSASTDPAVAVTGPHSTGRKRSPGRTWRRLRRKKGAMAALGFLSLVAFVAVFADFIAPHDPVSQQISRRLEGISREFLLGTDGFGRDVLSRLIFASRVAILAALQAVGLAAVIGGGLGVIAAYLGRTVDAVISRVFDGLMALPGLVVAMAIIGVLGAGLTNAMVAIGVLLSPRFYRVARGATQSVKHETYIEAARATGCPMWRILLRHVVPNISSPLMIQLSFALGIAIIAEASLSFLGLGAQPPQSSWGLMLLDGFRQVNQRAFLIVPPTVVIVATILSLSVLGDGLRDAMGREKRTTT